MSLNAPPAPSSTRVSEAVASETPPLRRELPAQQVHERLQSALESMRQAESRAVLWFGEVVERKLYRSLGYSSIHEYAAKALGFSPAKTSQFLRLTESLRELPKVRQAVARGKLSWTKAREVTKVATPESEAEWLKQARSVPRSVLEERVRTARGIASARKKGTPQPSLGFSQATPSGNGATTRELELGGANAASTGEAGAVAVANSNALECAGAQVDATPTVAPGASSVSAPDTTDAPADQSTSVASLPAAPITISFRLDPEAFARYEALIEAARKKGHKEKKETLILAGLEALLLAGAESDEPAPVDSTVNDSAGDSPAHAASSAQNGSPANTGKPTIPTKDDSHATHSQPIASTPTAHFTRVKWVSRPPYQITIHLCPQCGDGDIPSSTGARKLSPSTLKAILCDAYIQLPGKRNRATIPPSTRRAVLTRDRHQCRVAGCRNTKFLQVHHLIPRESGGSNKPENLITLCSECHKWTHEGGGGIDGIKVTRSVTNTTSSRNETG